MTSEREIEPCPWCAASIPPAFENLMDDPDNDDEVVKVWTMAHKCPVLKSTIWCEGATADECHTAWNRRSPTPERDAVEAARQYLAELEADATGMSGDDIRQWGADMIIKSADIIRALLSPKGIGEG